MKKLLAVTGLAFAAAALGACHSCEASQARFWLVRDAAGQSGYTVDTPSVEFETIPAKFVTPSGRFIALGDAAAKRPVSESEWRSSTNGADWSLHYCPIRKSCWASVSDK